MHGKQSVLLTLRKVLYQTRQFLVKYAGPSGYVYICGVVGVQYTALALFT